MKLTMLPTSAEPEITQNKSVPLPTLQKFGARWQLQVDGKPWLILGGELQNSTMSSARYMKTCGIWAELQNMNINTILGPVTWEEIEREEGCFDFTELDTIIHDARSHGFRLILLWFGSFKNGMSCYVPPWVKTNIQRFPRMEIRRRDGSLHYSNVISTVHPSCLEADQKALTCLMNHIKEVDGARTVIALQIENEVGLLGASRDVSDTAEELFRGAVPEELVEFLDERWDTLMPEMTRHFPVFAARRQTREASEAREARSWEGHFGKTVFTDELFMAYYYARYVETLAAAARHAYDIPLFTNAWLPMPGTEGIAAGGAIPGEYPSRGPTPGVLDVWQRFTPSLDFIAPDIYSADYSDTCRIYSGGGRQPFFIPEQRRDAFGVRRIWEAIGRHDALGAAPFGVDTQTAGESSLTSHYKLLSSAAPFISQARAESRFMCGFFFDEKNPAEKSAIVERASDYELCIRPAFVLGRPGPGYGLIIELAADRFLLVGKGFRVEFKSTSPRSLVSGILRFEEKEVEEDGAGLRTGRIFNGDETRSGLWANMPNDDPDYGEAFIPITIPMRTGIAEVQVYSVE